MNMDIHKLLDKMSIDEKIGQLYQLAPYFFEGGSNKIITGPLNEYELSTKQIRHAGAVLGNVGAKEMMAIQKEYLKHNEIPAIFMADVVHGYRTIFPIPLAIGSSFNPECAYTCARDSAVEASASGVHVTFSPMVDLVRDPRWGRVMESTGEDLHLNSEMAKAFVKGYQEDFSEETHIAACVKHFAGYGASEAGRDYNNVDMSKRTLRQYYLPAYKAAIDAGVKLVMTSFNPIDGVPSTGNAWLMNEVLRKEFGFYGTLISDWGAVGELMVHAVAKDGKECAKLAIEAGCDIEMMTPHYPHHLKDLIEEGSVPMKLLDESVLRILNLKEELGLFEDPFRGVSEKREQATHLCAKHLQDTREVAQESMVLLTNNGILPLDKKAKKIALLGPFAHHRDILGGWSCDGRLEDAVTLYEGVCEVVGKEHVSYQEACGCHIEDTSMEHFAAALKLAQESDTIILALGEDSILSGEGGSRSDINLPGVQMQFVREIIKLNKPFSVVLCNGRPLEISELANHADALLEAWFPGSQGGRAICDILFGDVNPSGKLAMSFPYHVGQIPVYYNCFKTGRPKPSIDSKERYNTHYLDIPNEPRFSFGHGLSYTNFAYTNLSLSKHVMKKEDRIIVSIDVTNTGSCVGKEVVQLYVHDMVSSIVRPVKELKAFQKVSIQPNEKKTITFEIDEEMLKFYTLHDGYASEPGEFEIMVGGNSIDLQIALLTLQ